MRTVSAWRSYGGYAQSVVPCLKIDAEKDGEGVACGASFVRRTIRRQVQSALASSAGHRRCTTNAGGVAHDEGHLLRVQCKRRQRSGRPSFSRPVIIQQPTRSRLRSKARHGFPQRGFFLGYKAWLFFRSISLMWIRLGRSCHGAADSDPRARRPASPRRPAPRECRHRDRGPALVDDFERPDHLAYDRAARREDADVGP